MQTIVDKDKLTVTFKYDPQKVQAIKSLTQDIRKYNPKTKEWYIKPTKDTIKEIRKFLKEWQQDTGEVLKFLKDYEDKLKEKQTNAKELLQLSKAKESELQDIQNFKGKPYGFQKAGIKYMTKVGNVINGSDMGLGKTLQSIAATLYVNAFPCLVVCPASLKYNWKDEWSKWSNKECEIVEGSKQFDKKDIIIINYDILQKHTESLKKVDFQSIIIDEIHYIKSNKAIRSKEVKKLAKKIPYKFGLSGTLANNKPSEIINPLRVIGQFENCFGTWLNFVKRYCDAKQNKFGWDISGASNLDELNTILRSNCYFRQTKKEVLTQLPDKQIKELYVDVTNLKEYNKAKNNIAEYLQQDIGDAEKLVQINTLKKIVAQGKLSAVKEFINDFLENNMKLVIFGHHKFILNELANHYNAMKITGDVKSEERQKIVDKFQNDSKCKLIFLNMKAGGTGLTLTSSSNVLFTELDWTPTTHSQAADRCHRIGQKNAVNVYYLLGRNTIDEDIYQLLQNKSEIVNAVNEGNVDIKNTKVLNELVKKIVNR